MLGEQPLYMWSVELMRRAGCTPVVLVVPIETFEETRASHVETKDVIVTPGGGTRQQSVANGLALVGSEEVVVHDAARPFATEQMVRDALDALTSCDAAITAVRVTETLKRVAGDRVLETVTREDLYRSQTPQAFRTDKLRIAHQQAREEGVVATDDAELVERYGGTVRFVPGSPKNFKITSSEDWLIAQTLVAGG